MTRKLVLPILALLLLLAAAPAHAAEQKMTLYSKGIEVQPYSGEQHYMPLPANGTNAPAEPGWITSIKVDVVKKRSANAKALSIQDVMIHHIVLHAPNAKWGSQGNCAAQFFARGEENQEMPKLGNYGLANMTPSGDAPNWLLTHMLMNHRSYPFKVYVRTRITYSDTPKTEVTPLWIDTAGCNPDPVFTVPGDGPKGSNYVDDYTYTVPEDGRIIGAQGHLHGGGKYQTLTDTTCGNRRLVRSQGYYGFPDHIFYRVRPILHEPSPISMSRTSSDEGIPVSEGDKLRLRAVYDNHFPHTRVMSIMMAYLAPGDVEPCAPMPDDIEIQDKPRHFRKPYPPATVPLFSPPRGAFQPFNDPISVEDFLFNPRRVVVDRGTTVTWDFNDDIDHDVAVANGPYAFSSDWIKSGQYSFKFQKRGTYGLFCTLHPTMSQQVKVD